MNGRLRLPHFIQIEAASGFILVACAAAAIVFANVGGPHNLYSRVLEYGWPAPDSPFARVFPVLAVREWVKEGLMAIFFFVVGLELKNEFATGQLSDRRAAMLPIVAALGGMIVPAAIYYYINTHGGFLLLADQGNVHGWPVPVATDIAFAVAALAVVGRGLPPSLRIFLLTLAVVDDLGAVVLIAILYTVNAPIDLVYLAGTAVALAAMLLLSRRRTAAWIYALAALVVWWLALHSGVNTSVAAVAAAFTVPVHQSTQLQKALRHLSSYIVLPIFAFAAAGVPLSLETLPHLWSYVPVGIALGLVIGKPIGVLAASYFVIAIRWARFPTDAGHWQLVGVACLCGIGFTMSLFIAALAFGGSTELYSEGASPGDLSRLGIMMGSLLSLVVGGIVLSFAKRHRRHDEPEEQAGAINGK